MKTTVRRTATVTALAVAGVLATALPAAAHVTVEPTEAAPGDYARLTFRVPNESEEAATVKLEVSMPEDTPLASVQTMKTPGWDVELKEKKLDEPIDLHGREVDEVVSTVTWTAEEKSDGVQPGEFAEFGLSVGPLPEKEGDLFFKTIQTYSDDEESAWIEEPKADGAEPESPAPLLKVTGSAEPAGHHSDKAGSGDSASGDSDTATILGAVAAGLGLVALVVAVLAFRRAPAPGDD